MTTNKKTKVYILYYKINFKANLSSSYTVTLKDLLFVDLDASVHEKFAYLSVSIHAYHQLSISNLTVIYSQLKKQVSCFCNIHYNFASLH